MPELTSALRDDLDRAGYYPELVADALSIALGTETIRSYLVHPETTFDATAVRRHVTVLVLTRTRLIVAHVDDNHEPEGGTSASASTEIVPLRQIGTVLLTQHVQDPARHRAGQAPDSLTLALAWGAVSRVELEPASCGDPECEADHGLTGTVSADDIMLRISAQAEGAGALEAALAFARALSQATVEIR